ncbi:hypothetical protein [Candidatus Palauibacter sp.]|uniref:hypothetical protein n=1 Tax=Candidatus Palauibacter sp. TaxID=3101350 RepID=UPI003B5AB9FE
MGPRLESTTGTALAVALLAGLRLTLPVSAQEVAIADAAGTLSSSGRAELWVQLENGTEHRLRFEGEMIEVDGVVIGSYSERGALASAWRDFVHGSVAKDRDGVGRGLLLFRGQLDERAMAWEGEDRDAARVLGVWLDELFGLAPETPAGAETEEGQPGSRIQLSAGESMQIVPGGLGFDIAGELARLRDALHRLGDAGESVDDGLAMIVHGDYRIPAESAIRGNIAILDGTLTLAGAIEGDVLLLDGTLLLDSGARVEGSVLQVGGDLDFRGESATIAGEILSDLRFDSPEPAAVATPEPQSGPEVEAMVAVTRTRPRPQPSAWSRFTGNLGNAVESLIAVIFLLAGLAVLGSLIVYRARERLETVSDTARREFARSFAMGLAGQILFLPALLVLVVLLITWPIVPFFVLSVGLATLVGYIAIAHGAGELFARRRYRNAWLEGLRRSNSYYYVVSGLVLLLLPFAAGALLWVFGGAADLLRGLIFFVSGAGTWVLATVGFGAVLLTRAGGRSVVVDWSDGVRPDDVATDVAGEPSPDADNPAPSGDDEPSGGPAEDA